MPDSELRGPCEARIGWDDDDEEDDDDDNAGGSDCGKAKAEPASPSPMRSLRYTLPGEVLGAAGVARDGSSSGHRSGRPAWRNRRSELAFAHAAMLSPSSRRRPSMAEISPSATA